jgi:hypothetical protein
VNEQLLFIIAGSEPVLEHFKKMLEIQVLWK